MKRNCPNKTCACTGACLKAAKPVVFLPLMTKPARNPHDGKKYLPEMWKPSDG